MNKYSEKSLFEIDRATEGLSSTELIQLCPVPGKWSAAEIIEHLTLAFSSTSRLLNKVMEGKASVTRSSLRQVLLTGLVIELGIFPSGRTAPEFTRPSGAPLDDIVERFRGELAVMDEAIGRCEQAFGPLRKIANHRIFGALNARQWWRFHWVHTRHHMEQIQRMRGSLVQQRNETKAAS